MKDQTQITPKYSNFIPKTCWQRFTNTHPDYKTLKNRSIVSNLPDYDLPDNHIETSKYNLVTFFPLNLIVQFTKPANIYFLIIAILQNFTAISVSDGKPVMFIPLSIVVAVSMLKDFFEDRKRHSSDQQENQTIVQVLSQGKFIQATWKSIKVGQIVKVKRNQYIPCDLLLLGHSKQMKHTFVETKNLDGETNLKIKTVSQKTQQMYADEIDLQNLRIRIDYERPNPFLYLFNGAIIEGRNRHMLDNNNIVLRGCSVKISQFIIGLCIYSGHETKIMLNSNQQTIKQSKMEKTLNNYFKVIFVFQIVATMISAILHGVLLKTHPKVSRYAVEHKSIVVSVMQTWGSWFLSFSNLIPISLLVTVDLVRWGQSNLLQKDQRCKGNGQMVEVQTCSINQSLGQVEYILTDKTGTLTKNLMNFKYLYVDNVTYGDVFKDNQNQQSDGLEDSNLPGIGSYLNSKKKSIAQHFSQFVQGLKNDKIFKSDRVSVQRLDQNCLSINERMKQQQVAQKNIKHKNINFSRKQRQILVKKIIAQGAHQGIRQALIHLALCHNVMKTHEGYNCSSPDELAFIEFAKFIGFQFLQKREDGIIEIRQSLVEEVEQVHRFKVLHTLEFTSDRKRMSVIAKNHRGIITLYTKGADDIMFSRILFANKTASIQKIGQQLINFASQGLRTLVLGSKTIERQQYQIWQRKYLKAITDINEQKWNKIFQLQDQIQQKLKFIGLTAIEDELQDLVKQTIQKLIKSKIKIWMITGDKKQTAISIGHSCGLLTEDVLPIVFQIQGNISTTQVLNRAEIQIQASKGKIAGIVTGAFLNSLEQKQSNKFKQLMVKFNTVICCRCSPKDKEVIACMVKQWGVTLAIGDGANDVSMINSADIGVGVKGVQGSQAARAADYVIGEFKILQRLVLYYGLNFYNRNSNVVLYNIFKNMIVAFPILFYGIFSMETATYIYDNWVFQGYNLIFVGFPILIYGFCQNKYSEKCIKKYCFLYQLGQNSEFFNRIVLFRQAIECAILSLLLVLIVFFTTSDQITRQGLVGYFEFSGMTILTIAVLICNIRIFLLSTMYNYLYFFICLFGIISYYVALAILTKNKKESNSLVNHHFVSFQYWANIILFVFTTEGFYVIKKKYQEMDSWINNKRIRKQLKMTQKSICQDQKSKEVKPNDNSMHQNGNGYAFSEDGNRTKIINETVLQQIRNLDSENPPRGQPQQI